MTNYTTWRNPEFLETARNTIPHCVTTRQLFDKLNLTATGANYSSFKRLCQANVFDISHFTGINPQKRPVSPTRSIEELLADPYANRGNIKRRLLAEGLLSYRCYICSTDTWQGANLSLQLDHINGVSDDHRIENLRLLCPNCHSQTENYCGRNIARRQGARYCDCGKELSRYAKKCAKCSACYPKITIKKPLGEPRPYVSIPRPTKITWPTAEELAVMVWQESTSAIAAKLGVSDNAVAKQCKKLGVSKPPRGYWAKLAAGK